MTTLRLLLGVVVTKDLELEQLDIKTTFLHRDFDEDIYISQSTGFTKTGSRVTSSANKKRAYMASSKCQECGIRNLISTFGS